MFMVEGRVVDPLGNGLPNVTISPRVPSPEVMVEWVLTDAGGNFQMKFRPIRLPSHSKKWIHHKSGIPRGTQHSKRNI